MAATAKHLFNSPESCVEDLVQGLLFSNPALSQIEGYNALVRSDIDSVKGSQVTLLSGGGSGHEPAHAGFVGDGMLSAAVLGNVFASPSVSSILATIRAVAGPKGVLLIVKNYTGDRLNFGMALERARQEGIQGMLLVVDDDCALEKSKGITGGRGIAGTVLVHKVVGAAARLGASLQEVFAAGERVVKALRTLGVALSTCTVPGTAASTRLSAPRAIEIGMGIHGEPGREQALLPETNAAEYIAKTLVEGVLQQESTESEREAVVLVNNLGTLPVLELNVVTKEIVQHLLLRNVTPVRVFVGSFMTSLDMNGLSLSVLPLSSPHALTLLSLIDSPTAAPAWVPSRTFARKDFDLSARSLSVPNTHAESVNVRSGLLATRASLTALCRSIAERVIEAEPLLTEYDSICGDGDCGVVMKKGATKVLQTVCEGDSDTEREGENIDAAVFCDRIANALSHSMGGTSGVLLELALRSMANHFQTHGVLEARLASEKEWIDAVDSGVSAIKFYGGADVGMRTMLDALVPATLALKEGAGLAAAAERASAGVEATRSMEGRAGRSNYVAEQRMHGTPDPGAYALCLIIETVARFFSDNRSAISSCRTVGAPAKSKNAMRS